jgi:uncharacterized protein (TIGR02466 family)
MTKQFPKFLGREDHFKCPIWMADAPEYLKELNKATDPYIKQAKKNLENNIKKRNKKFGNKGDMGHVFHSTTLIGDKKFDKLHQYVLATSHNLLDEMGYDLSNYQTFLTESWVQEFPKDGGGLHDTHCHWNGHISGFYFLKCDKEKTSLPVFIDPRNGKLMNLLPQKDESKITYASDKVYYVVKPGTMIFFPSFMPHQYILDLGYQPFRFIHWNCQAFPKGVVNAVQKK